MNLPLRPTGRRNLLAVTALCAALGLGFASHASAAGAPKVKFATSAGDFVVEVYPDKAPKTVENFLSPRDRQLHGAGRRV